MRGMNILGWIGLAIVVAGCGQQTAPVKEKPKTTSETPKAEGPAAAVAVFLEAVRSGNDELASKMLSTVARQKTSALNRNVTPPASDTAKFTVGKVDYVNDDGARVACTWTDLDSDGQPRTDQAIWVVRREAAGWRIVGVAAMVFPGEDPVVLNFEDPEDMLRQQKWVREEMQRRAEKEEAATRPAGRTAKAGEATTPATGEKKSESPVRR